jgi:hypothetical protein
MLGLLGYRLFTRGKAHVCPTTGPRGGSVSGSRNGSAEFPGWDSWILTVLSGLV